MSKILLTGVSGNVGKSVVDYLIYNKVDFVSGVRDLKKYEQISPDLKFVEFDFEKPSCYKKALDDVDKVYFMRPPHLTDVKGIFKPFIKACQQVEIKQIVFLSLLGIERNPFPPHYKIEKEIIRSGLAYTFIRPSFFMQNLINPHDYEIKKYDDLFIPAGKAKISFIDTRDIGEIIGKVLIEEGHYYKAYTLTGSEVIDFDEVAKEMSVILNRKITYSNPSLLKFRKEFIKRGMDQGFATVTAILYLTTKLGMANRITDTVEKLLNRKPRSMRDFLNDYQENWVK